MLTVFTTGKGKKVIVSSQALLQAGQEKVSAQSNKASEACDLENTSKLFTAVLRRKQHHQPADAHCCHADAKQMEDIKIGRAHV